MDLGSTGGTKVNGDRIPESRYVELKNNDILKFGRHKVEYVIILPGA